MASPMVSRVRRLGSPGGSQKAPPVQPGVVHASPRWRYGRRSSEAYALRIRRRRFASSGITQTQISLS